MRRFRLAQCVLLGAIAAAGFGATSAHADPGRWPSWPTEVDRIAAPLVSIHRPTQDRERTAALVRLQRYPSSLIEPIVVQALEDPSPQVRREALRTCYLRRMESCIDPATDLYREGTSLRTAALRVLALDPSGDRLDLLLDALRDPSDNVRAEAAQLAGWAPATGKSRARIRRALLTKLSDSASNVRQRAVAALGLQGPGDGTLAIARLLEDPEPSVRAAAATALGQLRARRAAGAMLRAIEGQNEGNVTRAMILGLARLPGKTAAQALLAYLDDPPVGMGALTIAEAIGDRAHPETLLIDGLVERLREPQLRNVCISALLWIGEPARNALQDAQQRGLSPELDQEVARLIAALEPVSSGHVEDEQDWPELEDVEGWHAQLRDRTWTQRLEAGAELGHQDPPWLLGAIHRALRSASFAQARPWLVALASRHEQTEFRDGILSPWATIGRWAVDARLDHDDRCLATLALGAARGRDAQTFIEDTLVQLSASPSSRIRSCAALASRNISPALTTEFLVDEDARVRVAAVLALRDAAPPQAVRERLAHLSVADPVAEVRMQAARTAQLHDQPDALPVTLRFIFREVPARPWTTPVLWIDDDDDGRVPVLGAARVRWTAIMSPAHTASSSK